ncbi:Beige/BEACH domain containing protein [Tritrichomonas foetus]|uniref:Beige/BEACH domain containing protein n=1 Tax=Tritrichomonas foetus TaxID=1144522 RepID=A0A1J4KJD5_9EUKA|nr:Beige/BEACH domain containing protein [Tritrichomonas foetus]|eukprot:OHT11447.1 Beige/BEACH domain containing protein [Tritrichomonas foetus]
MLQNIGNFFRKTVQKQETKKIPPIPQEEKFLINMFSQNLAAFSTVSKDTTCVLLFSRLVSQFATTFKCITAEHLEDEEIKLIFHQYSHACAELGVTVLHDKSNLSEVLFNSLTFISGLFGSIPYSELFFPLFASVIQVIKKNPSFFETSKSFLVALFKSTPFFPEFLNNDGFSLIFSSFFIQENIDSHQELLLRLLFKTVPMDLFRTKMKSKIQNLKIFIDLLTPQISVSYSLKNSCLFISYYIIAFLPSCKRMIDKFQEFGGFDLFNSLFAHNCPEVAHECYEIILIETNINKIVLSSIHDLFINDEIDVELRSSLIQLLSVQTNNLNDTYQKITSVTPLSVFIRRPPYLNKQSLETLAGIISSFLKNGSMNIDEILHAILELIAFPEDEDIPVDSYLTILNGLIESGKLTADLLVKEKFFATFLFNPQTKEVASFYEKHKSILPILTCIYISNSYQETKFPLLKKLLSVSQSLQEIDFFEDFLTKIFDHHFSSKIMKLLLINIRIPCVLHIISNEAKIHQESFDYFIENNGFSRLDEYLTGETSSSMNVMTLLASFSMFLPHQEIDNWINNQPVDSKLFEIPKDELSKFATGISNNQYLLHIPSLLPFLDDFNITSPYNLYLASKYGIPACLKRGIPIYKIPHISEIVNRYINPNSIKSLLNNNQSLLSKYIDIEQSQFSLYEFIPFGKPAFITFKQQFSSLSFWYRIPYKTNTALSLVNCSITSLELSEDNIIITTSRDKLNISARENHWHHVVIIFHMRRNITYKCEIIVDKVHSGFLKVDLQSTPSIITFGDEKNPLQSPFYLSKNIIINESMMTNEQIESIYNSGPSDSSAHASHTYKSPHAVFVNYLGFASYFRSSIQIEKLFGLLEDVSSREEFYSVFSALMKIQSIHHAKFKKFWSRMILSFYRKKDLIDEELNRIVCEYVPLYCSSKDFTKAIFQMISDVEIYFVFSILSIKQLFNQILENPIIDWKYLDKLGLTNALMTAIRSGIDEKLKLAFVPLISKVVHVEPTESKLRAFFNSIISLGDWTFDIVDLLREPIKSSVIQHRLLTVFVSSAKQIPEIELYQMKDILTFMMLYLDDRAVCLSELIAIYSYRNPKYVVPSPLLNYVFSYFSGNPNIWKSALSILSGNPPQPRFIKNFQIKRPVFLSTVLEMLNSLTSLCAYSLIETTENQKQTESETTDNNSNHNNNDNDLNPNHFSNKNEKNNEPSSKGIKEINSEDNLKFQNNLLEKVIHIMLSLDKAQYIHFTQQQCMPVLHSLFFLGICPNSYSTDPNSERVSKVWSSFSLQPPSKAEIKAISCLVTQSTLYQPIIPDNLCYDANSISSDSILYFPDNIQDCSPLLSLMKSSRLLDFFVSILFESESISSFLLEITNGTALMYNSYAKLIAQEMILETLRRITKNPQLNHLKAVYPSVHHASNVGIFSDNYLTLLSSLFEVLSGSSSRDYDLFLADDKCIRMHKDILLNAFCFIPEGDSHPLFELLIKYQATVFKSVVFNDNKFSTLWLHVTRPRGGNAPERIQCMTAFMQIIDNTLVSSYSPTEIQAEWILFKTKSSTSDSTAENEARITRMDHIIEAKQKAYSAAAKNELLARIYRSANFSVEQNLVILNINSKQRLKERSIFEFSLLARKKDMQQSDFKPSSYHLSPLSFPVRQSRALAPSPFEIKDIDPHTKVSKSVFKPGSSEKDEDFIHKQRIVAIEQRGLMNCSPEWCHFNQGSDKPFYSPFEYSAVIEQGPSSLLHLFEITFKEFGPFSQPFDVKFFYFIHPLPSVLFFTNSALILVVLAKGALQLISHPQNPVAFLPFTESVALGEFSQSTLFCGHVVIITRLEKIVRLQRHYYIHRKIGMCISTISASDLIIIFASHNDLTNASKLLSKKILRRSFPPSHLLFTVQSVQSAQILWLNNAISNYEYLLLLNAFSGRSFADLSQYPVVPWIANPSNLNLRDLNLPMGQLGENRAKHFDQTYELSDPKYYYGFHYSLPGAVFWLLMRTPPFTFFQWDLNGGWDDSQRLFVSMNDAYISAAVTNPSDLKELIPALYQTPEALTNISKLTLSVSDNVALPDWSNDSPNFFVENLMRLLNESQNIQAWIDLIFGYKQTGEAAIEAKNVFHPSSYHSCRKEDVEMDEDAFRSQVLNFGQCPVQLFQKSHPSRQFRGVRLWKDFIYDTKDASIVNPNQINRFRGCWLGENKVAAVPLKACLIPMKCCNTNFYFDYDLSNESISLFDITNTKSVFIKYMTDFAYISNFSISDDGFFLAISYIFGRVDVFQILYEHGKPSDLNKTSSFTGDSRCTMSSILSQDYLCASVYEDSIVIWNFATQMRHRTIFIDFIPIQISFSNFDGILSVLSTDKLIQYSLNAVELRSYTLPSENTCMTTVSFDFAFDKQMTIVCHTDGSITILAVSTENYKFFVIERKTTIHRHKIISISSSSVVPRFISIDEKGFSKITEIDSLDPRSNVYKCAFCENPRTALCVQCQTPICDACRHDGAEFCPNCSQGMDYLNFAHF